MLYDRPVRELMKDAANELPSPTRPNEIINWFAREYPLVKKSTVTAHIRGLTANDRNRHHYSVSRYEPIFTWTPDGFLGRYDPDTDLQDEQGGPDEADGGLVSAYEFEQFIGELLERDPDIEIRTSSSTAGMDYGFDYTAERNGRPLLIEVKSSTPQTSYRLEQIKKNLKGAADQYMQAHPVSRPVMVVAFPGVLSKSKMTIALSSRLEVWDGPYLRSKAGALGVSVPTNVALLTPEVDTPMMVEAGETHSLLRRLDHITPGQADWSAYEKYCEDLLNFLFVPPLKPAIPQSRDDYHANRRDYILPNYVVDGGFWQFMRSHYEAHYVVAEVKNLSGCLGKDVILQMANYLNPRGTGLFALLLARMDLDDTARWTRREQWVQHNKLIIGINDEDVRQMIKTKLAGNDPAELVRQKIEDFRLGI